MDSYMPSQGADGKSDDAWFKFYTRDFRDGVRRLKADEIGVYVLVLTLIYDAGGAIKDDDADIADDIGVDIRTWRRVRARLLEEDKLRLRAGRLTNKKADKVIAKRERVSEANAAAGRSSGRARRQTATSPEDQPNFFETSPEDRGEVPPKSETNSSENNDITRTNVQPQSPDNQSDSTLLERRPVDACFAVAGPGLGDPARYGTLHMTASRIAAAIFAGCDLELDILPVVQAKTQKPRGSPITSWDYFTQAWLEARDRRLAKLPPPDPQRFAAETTHDHRTDHAPRYRTAAEREQSARHSVSAGFAAALAADDLGGGDERRGVVIEGDFGRPARVAG